MTDANPSSDVRFDAFLSYSQRDMDVVRRVQSFLEDYPIGKLMGRDKGLRIYRDETDTRGGDLTDELMTALGVSGCLILCRSKNTDQSVWVTKEVAEFARLEPERPIISLRLDDHPVDKVPLAIRDRELLHLDLRDGWLLGRPRERTRIDLMRALAQIGGVELRQLIPWDRQRLEWTGDYEMFDSGNRSLQLGSKTIGVYVGGFQSLSHDLGIAECFGQLTRTEKRSFFDFKPLADYAGLPLYSSRQGSDERSDTVNYYNPELIRWLFEEFLPSPDAQLIKSLSYRSVYQIVFRPGVRLLAQTYRHKFCALRT